MPGGGKKNKGSEGENSVKMGKKVKSAWEEDNPLRKRSCTDLPCLLIFLAFIGGMVRKAEVDPGAGGANSAIHKASGLPVAVQNDLWTSFCTAVPHRHFSVLQGMAGN